MGFSLHLWYHYSINRHFQKKVFCREGDDLMANIRDDRSELLCYDNPDFSVFFRKNRIPSSCTFSDMSVHWHDEVEFIYVISGSVGYLVNGKSIVISQGHGLFVNARQLHLILQNGEDCVLYCLIFHPTILCSSAVIAKSVSGIVAGDIPYILLSPSDDDSRGILDSIASIDGLPNNIDGKFETMCALYSIWRGLHRKANVTRSGDSAVSGDLVTVRQIMLFIQENCSKDISLDDICRSGCVGKTKCNDIFRKYLNTTPMGYLRDFRIQKSIRLMESGMTVSQASDSVGIPDISHFSKIFKSKVGMSPREYTEIRRRDGQ